ncbi:MAG: hypothetical protein WCO26_21540, partial [Deltaproteobacteria bacterium]
KRKPSLIKHFDQQSAEVGVTRQLQKLMLRNRAGLLEKSYSGTFQRFDCLHFIPIQEFTFSDIVGYLYILQNPRL